MTDDNVAHRRGVAGALWTMSIFLLAACSSAPADQKTASAAPAADALPLVSDLAPGYDLDGNKSLDIRGVGLGDTEPDTKAKLGALFPVKLAQLNSDVSGVDGSVLVSGSFIGNDEARPDMSAKNYEGMKVQYSTPLTGNRVLYVTRQLQYGTDQPSVKDTLQGIFGKYGQPTMATEVGFGSMAYTLVWFDGKLVPPVQAADVVAFGKQADWQHPPKNPLWCLDNRAMRDSLMPIFTYEAGSASDPAPGCTAYLYVEVQPGDSPDLLLNLKLTLVDHQRFVDDSNAADKWLAAEIKKQADAKGGGVTPKL